jgi:hypothetical protein
MILNIDQEISKLVGLQKITEARLHEIDWYLNIEDNDLANKELFRQRLKSIQESLRHGLFFDPSQIDNKLKVVYSLYLDILKEISNKRKS